MNSQIIDEAAEWFVTLRDGGGDAAQRAQFAEWLLKSPEHVRAYLEMTPVWAQSASVDPSRSIDARALIARARAESNIVELESPAAAPAAPGPRVTPSVPARARTVRHYWIAASIAVLCVAAILSWTLTRPAVYATGIGEQRSIALVDGSRIELNARSRVQVSFSHGERTVELLEGQGLFKVAKDPQRPFIVRSGDARVRAIGTQFDVYRKATGTVVTVVEGQVELRTLSAAAAPPAAIGTAASSDGPVAGPADASTLRLAAGEQATVAANEIIRAEIPNLEAATAWTHRQLVFDTAALVDVAAEFNRYNFRRLVIRDAGLNSFPISGVFSSSDPDSLVQFLREQPEIAVEQTDTEVILSRKTR
jgi:transmembrane sensor